jgi:hypothetical protein
MEKQTKKQLMWAIHEVLWSPEAKKFDDELYLDTIKGMAVRTAGRELTQIEEEKCRKTVIKNWKGEEE